jgi:5-methylcytosine-specific restriction endonuclease McrA
VVLIASPAVRCSACGAAYNARRGTTTERGLGYRYQRKRRGILERDGGICWICSNPGADTIDHAVPRARGGTDEDANLRAAHGSCNYRRGSGKTPKFIDGLLIHGLRPPETERLSRRISHGGS